MAITINNSIRVKPLILRISLALPGQSEPFLQFCQRRPGVGVVALKPPQRAICPVVVGAGPEEGVELLLQPRIWRRLQLQVDLRVFCEENLDLGFFTGREDHHSRRPGSAAKSLQALR